MAADVTISERSPHGLALTKAESELYEPFDTEGLAAALRESGWSLKEAIETLRSIYKDTGEKGKVKIEAIREIMKYMKDALVLKGHIVDVKATASRTVHDAEKDVDVLEVIHRNSQLLTKRNVVEQPSVAALKGE